MTHEYGDPFDEASLESATERAATLHRAAPDEPLVKHVERAVREHVCSCAVAAEDAIEGGRSGMHEALVQEVGQRLARKLGSGAADDQPLDPIDLASADSFPASDPPAWIWQRPGE